MDTLEIILRNVSGVIIIIAVIALLMVVIGGAGFWILSRMERRRIRKDLLDRHEELWDGSYATELYYWLKVRWDMEQKNATTPVMEELDKLIRECEKRRQQARDIMMDTGQPVRMTSPEDI